MNLRPREALLMPIDENGFSPKTSLARDEFGYHDLTLSIGGREELFRQNHMMRLGVQVGDLKYSVSGKNVGFGGDTPLQIERCLSGEAYLPRDKVEVIGNPSSRTDTVTVSITTYDEAELDIIRRTLDVDEECFGKPTALLYHQEDDTDFKIQKGWHLYIYVSDPLFSEIEKANQSDSGHNISFNLRFSNVFCKAVRHADGHYDFTGHTHYLLKQSRWNWLFGKTENVFIQYDPECNFGREGREQSEILFAKSIDNSVNRIGIGMSEIASRLNWLIGLAVLIAALAFFKF